MKVICVIPAHLASVRLQEKVMVPIHGIPMLEHVRRRALISGVFDDVFVATGDSPIAEMVESYGGCVLRTFGRHTSGTSRVAEAVKGIDATHVVLMQGDEPAMLPSHLKAIFNSIQLNSDSCCWNGTAPLESIDELDKHSFVKCVVSQEENILWCFRRSPLYGPQNKHKALVRKILGLIAYKKDFLLQISRLPQTPIESSESIEQLRVIEHGIPIRSVSVAPSLPSVNEPGDLKMLLSYLDSSVEQKKFLEEVLSM